MDPINLFLWLIFLPLGAAPIIYLSGKISSNQTKGTLLARWVALSVLTATAFLLLLVSQIVNTTGPITLEIESIALKMDGIGLIVAFVALALGILSTIFSFPYMKKERSEEKYYAMLTAMIGTMIGLGCAADLFNLWIWFEAMALTSFLLVAFYRNQKGSLEAGYKYIVQSAVGSVFVILGISFVFMQTGELDLAAISAAISGPDPLLITAGAFFLIGFGVKSALVPLHTWLPDAHSQSPSAISAMLSGIVIEAGLIALLRSLGCLSNTMQNWGVILLGFGALNILVGNLMALRQKEVKRLLAYSSVAQMGYMLLGFGVAISYPTALQAGEGAFFHLINHAVLKGLAFLAAGVMLYVLHLANGNHKALVNEDLNGISRKYPLVAFVFSVAVLGLSGLPPMAIFMSKWQIFTAAIQTQDMMILSLVVFAALNSVLSLGYYAPLVNRIYRYEPSPIIENGKPASAAMTIPLIILTLASVAMGVWPTLTSWLTNPAASSLMTIFGN
ncbi:MAG: hypothetical protein JEZ06_07860 [Anaerolineaceae bacterium]|nr:hypothetical protein [Anaerolineaceae bacterium]